MWYYKLTSEYRISKFNFILYCIILEMSKKLTCILWIVRQRCTKVYFVNSVIKYKRIQRGQHIWITLCVESADSQSNKRKAPMKPKNICSSFNGLKVNFYSRILIRMIISPPIVDLERWHDLQTSPCTLFPCANGQSLCTAAKEKCVFSLNQFHAPEWQHCNTVTLTNPQLLRTPSMIPAENVAQFNEPLSFGTLMNLLTNGSFSMM